MMIIARYEHYSSEGDEVFYGEGLNKEIALENLKYNFATFCDTGSIDYDRVSFWQAEKIPGKVIVKTEILEN
jgi:hypothetical protein